MSVKVNLLPQEDKAKARAQQQRGAVLGAFALLLLALGGVHVWQHGRIGDANDRLAAEQETLTALQSREGDLAEYAELEARSSDTEARIQTALGSEVSVAGVMQDVATVFPTDAELEAFTLAFTEPVQPGLGGTRPVVGSLVVSGFAREGHAPGVERLLLSLDALGSLDSTYATASVLDEETDISTFTVQAEFGPEVRTGRYVDVQLEELP